MRKQLQHLPAPVACTLLGFYRRQRFYGLLRALLIPLLCYGVLALLATHLDRLLFLELPTRLWLSGLTHGLSLLAGAFALAVFAWRRPTVGRVAYDLERLLPKTTAERLVTLHDILGHPGADQPPAAGVRAALMAQLSAETVTVCERWPRAGRLVRDPWLRRLAGAAALLALVWTGLFALPGYQFPLMLQRLLQPQRHLPKPSFVRLTVTAAPVIARGGELFLQVQADGSIPRPLRVPLRWLGIDPSVCLLATAPGTVAQLPITAGARPMSKSGGDGVQRRLFAYSLSDRQETFSYRVRCGDAQTDVLVTRVIAQPRVTDVSLAVQPPPYTGMETVTVKDFNDPVRAYAGSRLQLRFAADQAPLQAARLVALQDGSIIKELSPEPPAGTYRYEFELAASLEMEIVVVNETGLENVERVRLAFEALEDQRPRIRLEYPAGDLDVVQGDLVPMHLEVSDDLGLLEAAVCYQVNAAQNPVAREVPLPLAPKQLAQTIATTFDLEKAGAVPGDEVLLWVRARDTGRNDERAPAVRLHVTAFAGDENERRRLVALRLVAQALKLVTPAADNPALLSLPADAYAEQLAAPAAAQGLALNRQPQPESLIEFLEAEHHLTDSAAAAAEVRLLHGVVAALLAPPTPGPGEPRRAALAQLADETLPALLCERLARNLIRRALSLRHEALVMASPATAPGGANRATLERRVKLMQEMIESTQKDLAALAKLSPRLKLDEVLAVSQRISIAVRDLKHDQPAQRNAAGTALSQQIGGWIGLLLPVLPEWQAQRRAAAADLRRQFERARQPLDAAWQAAPEAAPAAVSRWLAADARLVERSPFVGLAERLDAAWPGRSKTAAAAATVALAGETAVLARQALDSEYAAWLGGAHVTPAERRLAAALQALDLAADDPARAAAAARLRSLDLDADTAPAPEPVLPPAPAGLYAHLPALASAVASPATAHDEALRALAAQAVKLADGLGQLAPPADPGAVPAFTAALATLETDLARWEAAALRLSYQLHLDLTYGDPRRAQTPRLVAALPELRNTIVAMQETVPPLLSSMRGRLLKPAGANLTAELTYNVQTLGLKVRALEGGVTRAAKLFRGEPPAVSSAAAARQTRESDTAREIRLYYTAAWKLAEAADPAPVAEAILREPYAAAIVLEQRLPLLAELRQRLRAADEALKTATPASPAFRDALQQATQLSADFAQTLKRFKALDAEGAAGAQAAEIGSRLKALAALDPADTARHKRAVQDLRPLAERLEAQTRGVLATYAPPVPAEWWGGPAAVWRGPARRDAEHARSRLLARFDRARRTAVLGFDAVLARRDQPAAPLPDAPLSGALFAWRTLHSSLGGGTSVRIRHDDDEVKLNPWLEFVLSELDKTGKSVDRAQAKHRYKLPTSDYVKMAIGKLRH